MISNAESVCIESGSGSVKMYWNSKGQPKESVMVKLYSPGPYSDIFNSFEVNPIGPLHSIS